MRLKLKPFKTLKALAVSTSVFTFCMAPVAQGAAAANQKQLISQFLKDTKISTEKQTVGQFWQRVRHVFPKKPQSQMDQWVRINHDQPMPSVEASTFKGPDGKEQVRLNFLMKDGKTMTMTFTGDEERFVKINSVYLSAKDLQRYNNFDQVVAKLAKDPVIKKSLEVPVEKVTKKTRFTTQKRFLKGREIAQLPTLRAQVDYLLRMREASEAADKVFTSGGGKKGAMNEILNHDAIEYVWSLMLPDAHAATGPCVASGWIASYHQNSCARADLGRDTLLASAATLPFGKDVKDKVAACASSGGLPCNPMIFGFEDNNGNPHCIKEKINSATKQCNERAPLTAAGKEKIIQSIVAAKGNKDSALCKLNGESTVSQSCLDALDNYTAGLRQHYSNAADFCTKGNVTGPEKQDAWVTRTDIKGDQMQACDALKKRYFELAALVDQGPPIAIMPPPIKEDTCAQTTPGTKLDASGACVCESTGRPAENMGEVNEIKMGCPAAAVVDQAGKGEKVPKEECSEWSWCKKKGLYIGAGIAVAALLAWLLLKKDKKKDKKDPVYEPPAPVPEPTSTATTSPSPGTTITPIDPNPQPTCDAPNTVVNGVCTPPTIVYPEPPPSEGGTTTGAPISSGVR